MPWTIPDKGEGDSPTQSILFQAYLDALVAGIAGLDCVLSGLAVTGGADMTPAVAKGAVLSNRVMFAIAAADVTISAASATHPRIDLIVVNSSGALVVRTGSEAANPKPPAPSPNDVVIAAVWVSANDTSIGQSQITDLRTSPSLPAIIQRVTTPVVVNNNASIATFLTTVIPSGLMAVGRILRVRLGGTYLFNNGTLPTAILTISYGGVSWFVDTQIIATADADRGGWLLEFDIIQQGASDEALVGKFTMTNVVTAAHVPPTTGIAGNLAGSLAVANRDVTTVIVGVAGTVDQEAANQTLLVRWTMGGTANAANEIAMEYATVELL